MAKRKKAHNLSSLKAKRSKRTTGETGNASLGDQSHAKSNLRVSKDSLYMIIALWMEDFYFVEKAPRSAHYKKVGAVLVLPNDIVYAVDCSRDGVHAVQRLLMKHPGKAEGCKMFMSRKPCPTCAKLLVQAKVKRVLFLPFEPEYYRSPKPRKPDADKETRKKIRESNRKRKISNQNQMKQVNNLFTASPIAQTRFVLQLEETVLKDAIRKTPTPLKKKWKQIGDEKDSLVEKYGFEKSPKWMESIKDNLPWPEFDEEIQAEVIKYFENAMMWVAKAIVLPERELIFERVRMDSENTDNDDDGNDDDIGDDDDGDDDIDDDDDDDIDDDDDGNDDIGDDGDDIDDDDGNDNIGDDGSDDIGDDDAFDPVNNPTHANQARHFMTIARFLAERTDDPKTGVGAVIVQFPEMEIISLGWNGFPLKALYGEFPRASKSDESTIDKKYPYVIHAEQNALLFRNRKKIDDDAILFVTKSPCNECAPLIAMNKGIKTVVVDDDVLSRDDSAQKKGLGYKKFPDMVESGKFFCFQTRETRELKTGPGNVSKNLFSD